MIANIEELIQVYLRAAKENRYILLLISLVVASVILFLAITWPKSYTSSASIYADNSNILQPLMEGNAVATGIVNQARLAEDILFSRDFNDDILEAGGYNPAQLSPSAAELAIENIRSSTVIANQGRGPASLIVISHTDSDPITAFRVTQKYTQIFIEESVVAKQQESRSAFEFIESQVASYQAKLQESENRLSEFKSANNFGTLANANNRIATYRADVERLELEIVQLDTQIESVEAQLTGEQEVSRDLSEENAIRGRINALMQERDRMRAIYHDTYPDLIQINSQIVELQKQLETGEFGGFVPIQSNELNSDGVTPLHQELRRQLSGLITTRGARITQKQGIESLLAAEEDRARRINETEAELAELTRDYTVTQNFYNNMLERLENARVSMHLDEEQQGVTFRIQESAVIPITPDGFTVREFMLGSLLLAIFVPFGIVYSVVTLDQRVRTESSWMEEWPPLIATIPPVVSRKSILSSNRLFMAFVIILFIGLYGTFSYLYLSGIIG